MKLPPGAPLVPTKYPSAYKVKSEHDPKYTATPQTTPRYPSAERPGEETVKAKAAESGEIPGTSGVSFGGGPGVSTTSGPGPAIGGQLAPQAQKAALAGSMLGPAGGPAGWAGKAGGVESNFGGKWQPDVKKADWGGQDWGQEGQGGDTESEHFAHPGPPSGAWEKPSHMTDAQWEHFLETGEHEYLSSVEPQVEGGISDEAMDAWEAQTRERLAKEGRHEQYLQQMMANQMGFGTSGGAVFQQGVTGMKAAMEAENLVVDKWFENEKLKIEEIQATLDRKQQKAIADDDRDLQREIAKEIAEAAEKDQLINFMAHYPEMLGKFMQAKHLDPATSTQFVSDLNECMGSGDPMSCMMEVMAHLRPLEGTYNEDTEQYEPGPLHYFNDEYDESKVRKK